MLRSSNAEVVWICQKVSQAMFQIREIFIFISSHPESLFREGENGVEGKGWCKSSTLAGLSREKINRWECF